MSRTVAERLFSKVNKTETCWNWAGATTPEGYGKIRINSKMCGVHRVSYEIAKGTIPAGMLVDHICHNRSCVNPNHLRVATQAENQQNRKSANANSKSGVRNVYPGQNGTWRVCVRIDDKSISKSGFPTVEEAAKEAENMRRELMPFSQDSA